MIIPSINSHTQKEASFFVMEIAMLFLLGLGVGAFGTLVGIGGGLILIPLFLMFMTPSTFQTAQQAIGTSLFVVFLNALSGTLAYIRQKKVFYDAAFRFALATIPGAFIGSYLADSFTGKSFSVTFGAFLLFMSGILYFKSSAKKTETDRFDKDNFVYNKTLGVVISAFVGFLSSILGIGGGVIHVPLMIYALNFPTHIATATSHCVLAISSFTGVVSHYLLDHIVWIPAISIGLGATVGAQIGAKLSKKTKPKLIVVLLSCAVFALGLRLIFLSW